MTIYAIGAVEAADLSDCVFLRDENRKSPLLEFTIRNFRFIAEFRRSCFILSAVHAQLSVPTESRRNYGFDRHECELARLPYDPDTRWRGGYISTETGARIVANGLRFAIGKENTMRRDVLRALCSELARKAEALRVVAANDRDRERIQISTTAGKTLSISYSPSSGKALSISHTNNPDETPSWNQHLLRFVKETLVAPSMDSGGYVQIAGDAHEAPDSGHRRMTFLNDLLQASGLTMSDVDDIAKALSD